MSTLSNRPYRPFDINYVPHLSAIIHKPTKVIVYPAPRKAGDEIEYKPRHASDDEIKKHYHGIQTRDEN